MNIYRHATTVKEIGQKTRFLKYLFQYCPKYMFQDSLTYKFEGCPKYLF